MGRKKVHVKRSGSDLAFDIISYLILGIVSLIAVYPLYFVLIASISSPEAVNAGKVMLYPIGVTLEGYQKLFEDSRIFTGYRNTILYTAGFMSYTYYSLSAFFQKTAGKKNLYRIFPFYHVF